MIQTQPPFERHAITSREEWLEMRKQDVTASVAGCLIGHHDYATPYALWALKSGLVEDDQEETAAMQRGRLLEPVALNLLREQQPSWSVEAATHYFRDPENRIGATPDAFAIDPIRTGFGVVQIKTVSSQTFKKMWSSDTAGVRVPEWIEIQTLIEAYLTGASWAVVAALVTEHGDTFKLHIIVIPMRLHMIEKLRHETETFWMMVASGQPPEIDYARDSSIVERIHVPGDSQIDLSWWNAGPALAEEYKDLACSIALAEARRKEIRTQILLKMDGSSTGMINGKEFVTAKVIHRNGYTVPKSDYISVKFKGTEEAA